MLVLLLLLLLRVSRASRRRQVQVCMSLRPVLVSAHHSYAKQIPQPKPLLDKTIQWAQDNLIYKETRREAGTIFEQDLDDDRRCVRAARAAAADQTDREERANRKHLSIRPRWGLI